MGGLFCFSVPEHPEEQLKQNTPDYSAISTTRWVERCQRDE
jgi:hypothetical protein